MRSKMLLFVSTTGIFLYFLMPGTFACEGCSYLPDSLMLESCSKSDFLTLHCDSLEMTEDCFVTVRCKAAIKEKMFSGKVNITGSVGNIPFSVEFNDPCSFFDFHKDHVALAKNIKMEPGGDYFRTVCSKNWATGNYITYRGEILPKSHRQFIPMANGLSKGRLIVRDINGVAGQEICLDYAMEMKCVGKKLF